LVQHKKFKEAKNVLHRIGKVNKRSIEAGFVLEEEIKEQEKLKKSLIEEN